MSASAGDGASRGSASRSGAIVAWLRRAAAARSSRASLAALLALAGCAGVVVRLATGPDGFDHAAHLKRDLACADCHATGATAAAAGMPTLQFCIDCHDPKATPQKIRAAVDAYGSALGTKAFPTAAVKSPSYADVIFDHQKHAAAKVECTTCHAGVTTAGAVSPNPKGPLSMAECVACHKEKGASQDCATCHKVLRKDEKPPSHERGWLLQHGPASRIADRSVAAERCDMCHARSSCDACHAENAPKDHSNPFRVATHGLSASMDRSRCLACHRQDACDRCHEIEPPRSHRASFGAPHDTHCLTCHEPVAAATQGCFVCHKGTPSHKTAPPKPAWHVPGMNCGQCHAPDGVLTHVDNGTDCNKCHH